MFSKFAVGLMYKKSYLHGIFFNIKGINIETTVHKFTNPICIAIFATVTQFEILPSKVNCRVQIYKTYIHGYFHFCCLIP